MGWILYSVLPFLFWWFILGSRSLRERAEPATESDKGCSVPVQDGCTARGSADD